MTSKLVQPVHKEIGYLQGRRQKIILGGQQKKQENKAENSLIKPPSTLSVSYMKIQRGVRPAPRCRHPWLYVTLGLGSVSGKFRVLGLGR